MVNEMRQGEKLRSEIYWKYIQIKRYNDEDRFT